MTLEKRAAGAGRKSRFRRKEIMAAYLFRM